MGYIKDINAKNIRDTKIYRRCQKDVKVEDIIDDIRGCIRYKCWQKIYIINIE